MDATQIKSTDAAQNAMTVARQQIRDAADEVVGQVFYGTLMRQLRSSSLAGEYGHGGRGEEVFQAQLDQVFVARAGKARSTELSDAMAKRYERRAAAVIAYRREQNESIAALQSDLAASDVREAAFDVQEVGAW